MNIIDGTLFWVTTDYTPPIVEGVPLGILSGLFDTIIGD